MLRAGPLAHPATRAALKNARAGRAKALSVIFRISSNRSREGQDARARSISLRKLSGLAVGPKRCMTRPSRFTRNLLKFHLILSLPRMPAFWLFSQTYNG